MKTIISLTSIPSRFDTLPAIIHDLERKFVNVDEIWLNIPYKYNRFPDAEINIPEFPHSKKLVINRCIDYGPGTMYMGPAHSEKCDADMVVVVNDDTMYPPNLIDKFLSLYEKEQCCWCTSGFIVDQYVKNEGRVARYDNQEIDVTESYGGVLLKMDWLRSIKDEFLEYYELTYNDDIIISNLLSRMGIKRKSVFNGELHLGMVKQYSFGMGKDALFQNNGDGSHYKNNVRVFQMLKDKNKYFY